MAWARLLSFDLQRRSAEDPEHPGIPIDVPERWEAARILRAANLDPMGPGPMLAVFPSRDEAAECTNLVIRAHWAGEFARCLPLFEAEAEASLARGQFARAARCWSFAAEAHVALGHLGEGRLAIQRAGDLAARVGQPVFPVLMAADHLALALDEGWEEVASSLEPLVASSNPALSWARGGLMAVSARASARLGRSEAALRLLSLLVPWLERAPAWAVYWTMTCEAAEVLWALERLDHVEVIERAVRDKAVASGFRAPMVDSRLSLARLCALTGRHGEALEWFAEARAILAEQGALPLLAIADFDEALMYARRGGAGDAERSRPLLDAAHQQFEAIGMTGWIRRAEELAEQLR
jgi:tetratricopeptide (TPR) repeat protein